MFYTAVASTGIYCRPVCKARTPARANCRFFATAAAAERAGFRPCLRCRPELAPGRPDFGATLAQSIYQRIAAGALDQGSAETLAREIGVSARHMRRLLLSHFGVTPIEVAQTQRLLFAKQLLHQTQLSMTEVALASGFNSVRRFNAAFVGHYRLTPSALRRAHGAGADDGESLILRLSYRPPFDAAYWFTYLAARAMGGIEYAQGDVYRRTVRVPYAGRSLLGWYELRADAGREALLVRVRKTLVPVLLPLMQAIRRQFDLDADPMRISQHLQQAQLLGPLALRTDRLRVPGTWDAFELALRAVLGQQVSVRAASRLATRLALRYATPIAGAPHGLTHLPLQPSDLALASVDELASLGLPVSRAATLCALTQRAAQGGLVFAVGTTLNDMVGRLQQVPGIGAWTAHYIAMRAFGQADAFPAGDLGLRRALGRRMSPPAQILSERQVERLSAGFSPWRAYAASLLWSTLHTESP